jgi:hypothetical protein
MVSGGIIVQSGTVTINNPYFEDNAGHNMVLGNDYANAGQFTVTNPHMVKNPAHGAAGSYGAKLIGGISWLHGGDYAIHAGQSVLIDATHGPSLNGNISISSGTGPVVINGGTNTMTDIQGQFAFNNPVTAEWNVVGRHSQSIGGGDLIRKVFKIAVTASLGALVDGASTSFDVTDAGIKAGDVGVFIPTGGANIGNKVLWACDSYADTKIRITVFNKNGGSITFGSLTGNLMVTRF